MGACASAPADHVNVQGYTAASSSAVYQRNRAAAERREINTLPAMEGINETSMSWRGEAPGEGARVAPCPVCYRVSRPRSFDVSAWDCVARHMQSKRHEPLHAAAYHAAMALRCSACSLTFPSRDLAFSHLVEASDAAHAACTLRRGAAGQQTRRMEEVLFVVGVPMTPAMELYAAAKGGDLQACTAMLDGGASPDATSDDGFTALMTAAEAGHAPVVALLLARGCNLNAKNAYGQAALHFAAQNGRADAVNALLAPRDASFPPLDLVATAGWRTAAELARAAGYAALADTLAVASREVYLARVQMALEYVAEGSPPDSLSLWMEAVRAAILLAGVEGDDDEHDVEIEDGLSRCSVCITDHVDAALRPCFHACFCENCAKAVAGQQAPRCPICRGQVTGVQRIYL